MTPLPPLDELQSAIDEVATSWPEVTGKNVFGHRGWVRSGRMFGFLAMPGVSVKADEARAAVLLERPGARPFTYNERPMKGWPVLPLASGSDLDAAVEELRASYESVG
ncbi:MAG: MmcQ/YjbR family DNA-binding protein [Coriobacteriia bacterium]|nr:MmcQ/YjbR family DNA-binding protein [Coriobacteriia bacterium]